MSSGSSSPVARCSQGAADGRVIGACQELVGGFCGQPLDIGDHRYTVGLGEVDGVPGRLAP